MQPTAGDREPAPAADCTERRARFEADGFVALPWPVVPADELAEARDAVAALVRRADALPGDFVHDLGRGGGAGSTVEIIRASEVDPALRRLRAVRRCRTIAAELLGVPVAGYFDHVIAKAPGNGAPTAWHQDTAYAPGETFPATAHVWLALQDTTTDRGCMQFVPGSHLRPAVPHRRLGGDPSASALEAVAPDLSGAVACPLPAGGVTVHHPATLHHTGPNQTDEPRLAWILQFRDARSFGPPLVRLVRRFRR